MRAQDLRIGAVFWGAAAVLSALLGGCAPAAGTGALTPIPVRLTQATLAGPLCDGAECTCRGPGRDPGRPRESSGSKRYELRVGPVANELWVLLDDMVLYKTVERATACFYVDLQPGKHPLTVRARGPSGFAARLQIKELGEQGAYSTFAFACGGPALCQLGWIKDWHAAAAADRRALTDPCGSTRVTDIAWKTGVAPDRVHPVEFQLDLSLDVYAFAPEHSPGDPACPDR